MYIAAATSCFSDLSFKDACQQITDLEYDKVEISCDVGDAHLKSREIANDPEEFVRDFREITRLSPVAFELAQDVSEETLTGVSKAAKLLRVTQISIPASEMGTPFNSEIDRLRSLNGIALQDGIRLSIKTKTGMLTEDPHNAVELCQSVKGLGITLDPSYYMCGPARTQNFDLIYPYVYHVHLRDTSADKIQVPVGLGEVDYSRIVSQLKGENYSRILSVSFLPSMMTAEERPLEMRKLRMLLESILI